MTGIHSKLAALTLATVSCFMGGCGTKSDGEAVGAKSVPPIGSYVHVQFRRDFLGLASDKPTTPMGDGAAMPLAASGELKGITDEFIVLQVVDEVNRELWIPRGSVLLLDIRLKPPQP